MKEDLAGVLCKFLALSMPSPSSGPKARSRKLVSSEFSHFWVTFHASLHFLTKVVMNFCGHCCSSLPKLQVSSWELTCITEVASFGILLALKYPRRRNSSQTFWCFSKKNMLTLSPSRGVNSAFSCLPKGFNNLLTNLRALDFLGNWNLMPSLVHTKEEFWPTRTFPTSAPSSSIILLSGWRYSSPRCLCSSKKSMLTFSKHIQNDLEEEGRTDVDKVLIGQNSPMRTFPTSAPPSSILLAKVLVLKQKVYAHLLSTPTKWPRGRR